MKIIITKSVTQPRSCCSASRSISSTALRYSRGLLISNIGAQDPGLTSANDMFADSTIQKSDQLRVLRFSYRVFECGHKSNNQNPKQDDSHDCCIDNILKYVSLYIVIGDIGYYLIRLRDMRGLSLWPFSEKVSLFLSAGVRI
jgi:hypothetical protein